MHGYPDFILSIFEVTVNIFIKKTMQITYLPIAVSTGILILRTIRHLLGFFSTIIIPHFELSISLLIPQRLDVRDNFAGFGSGVQWIIFKILILIVRSF